MLHLASTDGIELAVHELGTDPRGPATVLAHATGFHGRVWEPLARRLTGRAAWAPDLRAHGDSPTPPDHPLDWERFADDVLAVVDTLQLHRPLGVGHSKGGAALLLAEARRPGTFAALWVYEPVVFPSDVPGGPFGDTPNPLAAGARRRRSHFESLAAAEANFGAKPPMSTFDPEAVRAYVRGGFAAQPDGSVELKCRPEDEARIYEMGGRHAGWERLGSVSCPVTVVRGSLALPGPALFADRIADRLPQGTLEIHDDLAHFGPLEDPTRMAESVLAAAASAQA